MPMNTMSRIAAAAILLLSGEATFAGEVPATTYLDPIAGFSITIPEDWTPGTGILRDTTLGINNPYHPSFAAPMVSVSFLPAGTARVSGTQGAD